MRIRIEVANKFSTWARVYSRDHQCVFVVAVSGLCSDPNLCGRGGAVCRYVVPFFTVTIELDGNTVKNILWDEGCFTCASDAW